MEESILKLESASTEAQTNKMNNQIMKFSLNNEYERFLNEMNNKLETLVGVRWIDIKKVLVYGI